MAQAVPFDALLGAAKSGLAIGATLYQLDGSTVHAAFSTAGWYEAPAGSGGWHHAGLSLPDAGGVVAVGVSGTEYIRIAIETAKLLASSYTAPPSASDIDTQLSGTHGAGSWATATGFATPTNVIDTQTAITAAITALHNLSTADIDARLAAYDGATGADVTATQTAITNAIAALNNLSQAQAQSAATASLNAYDAPTKAELDTAQSAITTAISGLNNLSSSDILALTVETGHSLQVVLRALYAVICGRSLADNSNPTQISYYAPDGTTVRVTHNLTDVERTNE